MIETIEIDFDYSITNLKEETLYESKREMQVSVIPFWNSHGNMSQFGEIKKYKGKLKIVKRNYTQLGCDWEDWYAIVGNEKVAENIEEYTLHEELAIINEIVGMG
jgi:hypothetical protein